MNEKKLQYKIYKAVSGEFEGLSVKDAASKLGVSAYKVRQVLTQLEATSPQLFPLTTKREAEVRTLRVVGVTTAQIARMLRISERRVRKVYAQLEAKGHPAPRAIKYVAYDQSMDGHIKQKF